MTGGRDDLRPSRRSRRPEAVTTSGHHGRASAQRAHNRLRVHGAPPKGEGAGGSGRVSPWC